MPRLGLATLAVLAAIAPAACLADDDPSPRPSLMGLDPGLFEFPPIDEDVAPASAPEAAAGRGRRLATSWSGRPRQSPCSRRSRWRRWRS